jgi:hypothetical protein
VDSSEKGVTSKTAENFNLLGHLSTLMSRCTPSKYSHATLFNMAPPSVDYSVYLVTDSTPAILGDKDLVAVVKAAVEGGG